MRDIREEAEVQRPEAAPLHTARVLVLCSLVILMEGFDVQAAGVSAPRLAAAFHLVPAQVGWFLGASAVGVFLAAVVGGIIADRLGRKPVLITSVLLFGLASLTTVFATGLWTLMAARFVTGLGLGAAMPVTIALASDHSPAHMKKRAVGFIYAAIPIGGALSGVVMSLGPGWRAVYGIGGVAPLAVVPVLAALLPWTAPPPVREPRAPRSFGIDALAGLLGGRQAVVTVPLWLATFGTLLVMYLLLGWMPTLAAGMGLSGQDAQYVQMLFNLGASIGAATGGYLLDRKLVYSTPAVAYVALAALLAILGLARLTPAGALLVAFGVGGATILAQAILYAVAPLCYPVAIRNTGVGAAVAAGRLGTIAGPLLAGLLLGVGRTAGDVLISLIPVTLGAGVMALLVARAIARRYA